MVTHLMNFLAMAITGALVVMSFGCVEPGTQNPAGSLAGSGPSGSSADTGAPSTGPIEIAAAVPAEAELSATEADEDDFEFSVTVGGASTQDAASAFIHYAWSVDNDADASQEIENDRSRIRLSEALWAAESLGAPRKIVLRCVARNLTHQLERAWVIWLERRAIYVSSQMGNDANPGTRWRPMKTISGAIVAAHQALLPEVRVMEGEYLENRLSIPDGIALLGGYGPFGAGRDADAHPTVLFVDRMGVLFRDIREGAELSGFDVRPAGGQAHGESSYAVRVLNSQNVSLIGDVLRAGPGANGDRGADGAGGVSGGNGSDGGRGQEGSTESEAIPGLGGAGGTSPCGNPGSRGGGGGDASPRPGADGASPEGALCRGGATGDPVRGAASDGMSCAPGRSGAAGFSGAPGSPSGTIGPEGWSPSFASAGDNGQAGLGGGGGGGGGGFDGIVLPFFFYFKSGSGGGGGGAGGCGGLAGGGGQGGGGSFGVFAYQSVNVFVIGGKIFTSLGGNGGAGGLGGSGGPGGRGGAGGLRVEEGGAGARGANGGNGGTGGAGGPGAGGPSVAVVTSASLVSVSPSTVIELGSAGLGAPGALTGLRGAIWNWVR